MINKNIFAFTLLIIIVVGGMALAGKLTKSNLSSLLNSLDNLDNNLDKLANYGDQALSAAKKVAAKPIVTPSSRYSVTGKVTAIQEDSFTIEKTVAGKNSQKIAYMIKIKNSTVFRKSGKVASFSDVTDGDTAMATGAFDIATKTIIADIVAIVTPVKK